MDDPRSDRREADVTKTFRELTAVQVNVRQLPMTKDNRIESWCRAFSQGFPSRSGGPPG